MEDAPDESTVDDMTTLRNGAIERPGAEPDTDGRLADPAQRDSHVLGGGPATRDERADQEPDAQADEQPRPVLRDQLARSRREPTGRAEQEHDADTDPNERPRERPEGPASGSSVDE